MATIRAVAEDRRIDVYLEEGQKRTFACALNWPGWCRSGRTADDALAALVAYGPRYALVAKRARIAFNPPHDASALHVTERVRGSPTTDFGAPGVPAKADTKPMTAADLTRQRRLLTAAWDAFDTTANAALGVHLRTGPRGGGRSVGKMIDHVIEADEAYLGGLGARPPRGGGDASREKGLHEAMLEALTQRVEGRPLTNPRNTKKPWSPRYFIRRSAWHALDHAWEIEDRSRPEEAT
jgi:hypothetical protein